PRAPDQKTADGENAGREPADTPEEFDRESAEGAVVQGNECVDDLAPGAGRPQVVVRLVDAGGVETDRAAVRAAQCPPRFDRTPKGDALPRLPGKRDVIGAKAGDVLAGGCGQCGERQAFRIKPAGHELLLGVSVDEVPGDVGHVPVGAGETE